MLSDFRFALRQLAKSPGFTVVALVTLALGIGVNTSMFSALRTLVLRTLPYPDGDQLVRLYHTTPQSQSNPHSPASFLDYRELNSAFTRMAALQVLGVSFAEPDQPAERLLAMKATADLFPLLGLAPALGRVFTPEEDQPGRDHVVVLSHDLWAGRFARDPAIIGRQIRLDGSPVTVIGVMPPGFNDPLLFGQIDVWRPMAFTDSQRATRVSRWLTVIARLKPGVSLTSAQTRMNALAASLALTSPQTNAQMGLRLVPLSRGSQVDDNGSITLFVTCLAALVLLIACANLANLQFARTAARARELGIRAALGASRGRLMREVLTESLLLAFIGGALGLLVALWCNAALGNQIVVGSRTGFALPIDLRAFGFALIVSTAAGVGFGLLPAWLASRADFKSALKQDARGTTMGFAQHRVQHALIIAEVALALVLLSSAATFIGGLKKFTERDPGWRVDNLLTGYVSIGHPKNGPAPESSDGYRRAFVGQLEQQLGAIPGVEHVALAKALPTWTYYNTSRFVIEGRPAPAPGLEPLAHTDSVTPGFFTTLGLGLTAGRGFTAADRADTPLVLIINESMARALWPGENPIGQRIGSIDPANRTWREIVGVVGDAHAAGLINNIDVPFQIYYPWAQAPDGRVAIALRTRLAPETLVPALRRAVAALDPDQPLYEIDTVRHEIDRGSANLRLAGWTLAGFALLGLLLAAIGIYGVIANTVVQRTREIGIRMALGAQVRDVLVLVLGQGLRLALFGAALGLAGAFAVSRLLRAIAPGLSADNGAATAIVTLLLITIATLACYLPARRAAKVDPVIALRAE